MAVAFPIQQNKFQNVRRVSRRVHGSEHVASEGIVRICSKKRSHCLLKGGGTACKVKQLTFVHECKVKLSSCHYLFELKERESRHVEPRVVVGQSTVALEEPGEIYLGL